MENYTFDNIRPTKKILIRIYHYFLKVGLYFVYHKEPKLLNNYHDIVKLILTKKIKCVFITSSKTLKNNGLLDSFLNELTENNIKYYIFTDVKKNPTTEVCLEIKKLYLENKCEAMISVGGGSVMDATKGALTILDSKKDISKYEGLFKIHHKLPLHIAIPSTSGTGSETTFVTVITDEKIKKKFEIISNKLTPDYALLDANLLLGLPNQILLNTTLDALTHATESYLNRTSSKKSREYSLKAIKLIKDNLTLAINNPSVLEYKKNLLYASFLAGKAFNRGLVGPVHALAHAVGGLYNLDHGYLNMLFLNDFLKIYIYKCPKKFNKISTYLGLNKNNDLYLDAYEYIKFIDNILILYNVPHVIKELKKEDINLLSKRAYKEAILLYPSPTLISSNDYENILLTYLDSFKSND